MGNPPTTDRRSVADDSDAYVIVDERRIILDLPDTTSPAAVRSGRESQPGVTPRVAIVRPPLRDDRRGH
jgi:hypothetical protein